MKIRKIAFVLLIAAIPALFVTYKAAKYVVKAYNEYDASTVHDRGEAPEITSTTWLNTTTPVSLNELRGQVVLVDFWRIQCPECIHALPYIKDIAAEYKAKGVQFVSVHSPETPYEADINNVRDFIAREGITFPVAVDNDQALYKLYGNRAWPTVLVLDRNGHILYRHVGEGRYDQIRNALNTALSQK